MKMLRWTRTLVLEGPEDWINLCKQRAISATPEQDPFYPGRDKKIWCEESKIEEVTKNEGVREVEG